jgi:uncharacterized Zn finger protein (UPF0148 family)
MPEPIKLTESDIPLFDVFVELPTNRDVSAVDQRSLLESGLTSERLAALLKALRNSPKVKIGASVTRERSEGANKQFTNAGLIVSIVPVLALQAVKTGAFDGRLLCPACSERVVLPDNRQCPSCGVFVDKVDEAFLLKRKIVQQERGRLEFQAQKETVEAEKQKSIVLCFPLSLKLEILNTLSAKNVKITLSVTTMTETLSVYLSGQIGMCLNELPPM